MPRRFYVPQSCKSGEISSPPLPPPDPQPWDWFPRIIIYGVYAFIEVSANLFFGYFIVKIENKISGQVCASYKGVHSKQNESHEGFSHYYNKVNNACYRAGTSKTMSVILYYVKDHLSSNPRSFPGIDNSRDIQ